MTLEFALFALKGSHLAAELEQVAPCDEGALDAPGPLHRFPWLELVSSQLSELVDDAVKRRSGAIPLLHCTFEPIPPVLGSEVADDAPEGTLRLAGP